MVGGEHRARRRYSCLFSWERHLLRNADSEPFRHNRRSKHLLHDQWNCADD